MANSNKTYGRNYRVYRPRNTRTVEVELPSMPRKTTSLPPILIIVFGFLLLVLIGTILLSMPFAYADGMPHSLLNAVFTSTTSVCVTGLSIVEMGTYWSTAGQIIIMLLVQVGGFGFMCSSTLILLLLGQHIGIRERNLTRTSLDLLEGEDLKNIILKVVQFTLVIEIAGMVLLYVCFLKYFEPSQAFFFAMFHSVSAFNNAGIDILGNGNSVAMFAHDNAILMVLAIQTLLGSLGFAVIADLISDAKFRHTRLDTKVVVSFTALLIVVGMVYFILNEWNNPATIGNYSFIDKLVSAFFHSVQGRTGGFSAVPCADTRLGTILLFILLMSIGASSGSLGGGIKVNNVGLLFFSAISTLRGDERPKAFGKEFAPDQINKSLTLVISYYVVCFILTLLLSWMEDFSVVEIMFEVFSAFSTVGASMGITPLLSTAGKIIVVFIMFIGRLGPMTLVSFMMSRNKYTSYRYPVEYIRIMG